ncbi:cation transport protein-domain-containing protein [Rhexocercosporidium sp. MPI-PUGE-AT-0058]|nr:cation transport protein-domain-containing protein [Rhexocercosporidium sp. MPI-PUGE-AT-0058]
MHPLLPSAQRRAVIIKLLKSIIPLDLNFIAFHYIYLVSLAFASSLILFAGGGVQYVDALFFGSGAVTQSGLNTIDVNALNTLQQTVLYLFPLITTPIFINTVVVLVRIYWFEQRFRHIVRDSKVDKRSKTKDEARVHGRETAVLNEGVHDDKEEQPGPMGRGALMSPSKITNAQRGDLSGSLYSPVTSTDGTATCSEKSRKSLEVPGAGIGQSTHEEYRIRQHIAFVERQRSPREDETLRIPGPRDFDRGVKPHRLSCQEEKKDRLDPVPPLIELDLLPSSSKKDTTNAVSLKAAEPEGLPNADEEGNEYKVKRAITFDIQNERKAPSQSTVPIETGVKRASTTGDLSKNPSSSAPVPGLLRRIRSAHQLSRSASRASSVDQALPYLSYAPTVGRNSTFVNLTQEQREELGGIEYRALKTLAKILIGYYVGFHVLAWVCFLPWIMNDKTFGSVVTTQHIGRPWWAFFTSASLFNDLGFTLTPDSMISFQTAVFPLIFGSFLIVIGNTGFPCMLRFIIWLCSKIIPVDGRLYEELRFLLDHPRRCFTLLFPSKATWWLFWTLVIFNGVDLLFFIILDLNDDTVMSLSPGIRVLAGWFQATSTRTAGFAVVNLAELRPAIQVSYLIMMYISVFPVAMSVRRTNVFEERSLGIWGRSNTNSDTPPSYVGAHLRRQLSFDMWYIFLGLFIIAIAEGKRLEDTQEDAFTGFSLLFEIVSAYGTVGLSLGHPEVTTSLSGKFTVVSKLVIIAMQVRGRHRGLPYKLDRAILLPGDMLNQEDVEEES